MNPDAPFPAIPATDLGTTVSVDIDAALLPYLIGVIQPLVDPDNFRGTQADILATSEAFDSLLVTLSNAT